MYTPAHFRADDETTADFLASVRAADLVTVTDEGLVATFLPMLFDPERGAQGAMVGHVARNNDQWRRPPTGEALVIAHAPDSYISPSWYPSKAEHGRVVPTWNYAVAHVYGDLVVHDDVEWLDQHVRRLTERHESPRDEPWDVSDAPDRYVAGQLRAIVGVEVLINRVEMKVKMSQNRSEADVDGVVDGLTRDGLTQVANLVDRSRR
ncbi:MAG TPA: FMN-binding negative transcriptional regulator [Nocardioides sp.]|nr:FMN-binding negative transcriptional regulator [Nocardioides sp.]